MEIDALLVTLVCCGKAKVKDTFPRIFAPSCNWRVAVMVPLLADEAVKVNVRETAGPSLIRTP